MNKHECWFRPIASQRLPDLEDSFASLALSVCVSCGQLRVVHRTTYRRGRSVADYEYEEQVWLYGPTPEAKDALHSNS